MHKSTYWCPDVANTKAKYGNKKQQQITVDCIGVLGTRGKETVPEVCAGMTTSSMMLPPGCTTCVSAQTMAVVEISLVAALTATTTFSAAAAGVAEPFSSTAFPFLCSSCCWEEPTIISFPSRTSNAYKSRSAQPSSPSAQARTQRPKKKQPKQQQLKAN